MRRAKSVQDAPKRCPRAKKRRQETVLGFSFSLPPGGRGLGRVSTLPGPQKDLGPPSCGRMAGYSDYFFEARPGFGRERRCMSTSTCWALCAGFDDTYPSSTINLWQIRVCCSNRQEINPCGARQGVDFAVSGGFGAFLDLVVPGAGSTIHV